MSASAAAQGRTTGGEGESAVRKMDWLLGDLVERVGGARHALLLSMDGLVLSSSALLDRDSAERLAAIAVGFASLAQGACGELGAAEVRQSVVEMDSVFFFVLLAGPGTRLALVTDSDCDMGQAAFEVNRLVRQVGPYLAALPRAQGGRG